MVNGAVCASLYALVHPFRDPGGERFQTSLAALEDYLRNPGQTLDIRPNNSTQLWDTSLVVQVLGEAQRAVGPAGARTVMQAALGFIDTSSRSVTNCRTGSGSTATARVADGRSPRARTDG